jgi:hypothetical protein
MSNILKLEQFNHKTKSFRWTYVRFNNIYDQNIELH